MDFFGSLPACAVESCYSLAASSAVVLLLMLQSPFVLSMCLFPVAVVAGLASCAEYALYTAYFVDNMPTLIRN